MCVFHLTFPLSPPLSLKLSLPLSLDQHTYTQKTMHMLKCTQIYTHYLRKIHVHSLTYTYVLLDLCVCAMVTHTMYQVWNGGEDRLGPSTGHLSSPRLQQTDKPWRE